MLNYNNKKEKLNVIYDELGGVIKEEAAVTGMNLKKNLINSS